MKNPSIDSFILRTQNPDQPAILSSLQKLTYSQLQKETDSLAAFFVNEGIIKSDRIAVAYNISIQFIRIIISLWKINAIPVVLNVRLKETELNDQIKFAGCKNVIANPEIDLFGNDILHLPDILSESESIPSSIQAENKALIIFTSGSSGKPKAVVHTFENLYQSAVISNQILKQTNESKWLASLPFYHIGGFSIITRSLLFGCPLILPDSSKTDSIAGAFKKFSPTHCSLVPTQIKRLIESGIRPNKELTNVLIGGGAITKNQTEDALKNNWPIIKVYGSTETASLIAAIDINEISEKPESVGKILRPNEIKIEDENGKPCSSMQKGEIVIKSPALFKKYLNNENETHEILIDSWYHSGDIGWLDDDGYLFLEARRIDLIVSGGENINPNEIEELLLKHPEIIDAVVFPVDDDEWGQIPAAVIVKKNNQAVLSADRLISYLKKFLAGYKIPRKIFFEDSIPRNELGKIERNFIKNKYETS
jgi:o-succinylbenzoate---CoA ligase